MPGHDIDKNDGAEIEAAFIWIIFATWCFDDMK
jgi:hypothetical protein